LAAGFFAKLPAHVARFTLILHALWNADDPRPMVSAETMGHANEVGEFMRAHIGAFLALLHAATPPASAGVQTRIIRIIRIISADTHIEWVSRSAILDGLRNVKPSDLTAALEALEALGQVERRTVPTATKPAEQWRLIVPTEAEIEKHTARDYSGNSDYSGADDPAPGTISSAAIPADCDNPGICQKLGRGPQCSPTDCAVTASKAGNAIGARSLAIGTPVSPLHGPFTGQIGEVAEVSADEAGEPRVRVKFPRTRELQVLPASHLRVQAQLFCEEVAS